MEHIRPYKLFALIESAPPDRAVNVTIPCRRGAGGTTLLETVLILAAIRIVKARRIFEFGTFLGSNTLNMALNTPPDAEIFTLDLDAPHAASADQDASDAVLTHLHLAVGSSLDFVGSPVSKKITTLFGDSTSFDFSQWTGTMDFQFIDGGHDLATVQSDTQNAFKMAAANRESCIVWHDYRSWDYPALTCYLDELANENQIFHIEDTKLCIWFNDPFASILPRLGI